MKMRSFYLGQRTWVDVREFLGSQDTELDRMRC